MQIKGKVLFLTPNLKGVKDGLNRIQPPLGPMIMAEILRRRGHRVKIHDTALEGWSNQRTLDGKTILIGQGDSEIRSVISDFDPDVVAISALFTNLMESAHNLAALSKEVKPSAHVVLGGNHISNAISDYLYSMRHPGYELLGELPDMNDPNIDFAMRGEVDFEFPRLVDTLLNHGDLSTIAGLVRRDVETQQLIVSADRPAPYVADDLPAPARDLVNMEGYFEIGAFHSPKSRSKRVLSVMASRGCPEKCTFCTTPEMWGAKVRWRSTESIVQEIRDGVNNYKIGEIQFEDDTLTARKRNLLDLCKELETFGLPWCTPNGTKTNYHLASQPDLYQAMADSGCYQITLACESGVQRVLDQIIGKKLNIEEIRPSIENAKKAGMLVHTFWILGYPGETYDEMQRTVDFAMGSGADSFSFAILSPLPGTPIYRQVVRDDLWWPGRGPSDLMYRSSLVRVDGFDSPEAFEQFVTDVNVKANSLLKTRDPERFRLKYGKDTDERSLVKQT